MSLRDRLLQRAAGLAEDGVTLVGDYVAAHELGPRLRELLEVKDDLPSSLHELLLKLVDAVRGDEQPGHQADVERVGKRNERIALAVKAMPTAGVVAGYVADLYCDAIIVCGVVDTHRLPLTDEAIGAHLLVLWGASPDLATADAIMGGNDRLLLEHAADRIQARWDATSKVAIVRMLWQLRRAGLPLAGQRNLKGFIWPSHLVHQRVDAAERLLAQWYPDPFGRFDHRYWERRWTEHVSDDGVARLDPP
jgi:hypothetical protein